jgi:hypothetical protein
MKRLIRIIVATLAAGAIVVGAAGCHTHVIVRSPGNPVTTTSSSP